MLTIITVEELEKLYRNMKLEGSISFNFIPQDTASLLKEIYLRKTSAKLGEFFLIKNYNGKDLEAEPEAIPDLDHSIFKLLPNIDKDYVAILVNPKNYSLLFGSDSLDKLLKLNTQSDDSVQELRRKISRQRLKDENLVYAVSSIIRAEEVMRVIYPKNLEGEVRRIAEATKARRKALGATNIFG